MGLNKKVIDKLSNGEISIKFKKGDDFSALKEILKKAFPDSEYTPAELNIDLYYYKGNDNINWAISPNPKFVSLSIEFFLVN